MRDRISLSEAAAILREPPMETRARIDAGELAGIRHGWTWYCDRAEVETLAATLATTRCGV